MIEPKFTWDNDQLKLKREPESPVCTREENMRFAKLTAAIRSAVPTKERGKLKLVSDQPNKTEVDTAKYEMAMLAYTQREFYQPCKTLPAGFGPMFMRDPTPNVYQQVRDGIRALRQSGGGADAARLITESREAQNAVLFQLHVAQVVGVEKFNESCASTLLMGHAWLSELNPVGDAVEIKNLQNILRVWFEIDDPETDPGRRHAQAKHHAQNTRWLSRAWRDLWACP